jgi:hypothetical protein
VVVRRVGGCRLAWCGVGQRLDDQWRWCGVVDAESGDPDELAGWQLGDVPAAFVAESVVVAAG